MNFSKVQKWKWATLVIIVVLVILNPSLSQFKEYKGWKNFEGLKRTRNFLVFSKYEDDSRNYIGVLYNFFEVKKVASTDGLSANLSGTDSTRYADSTIHSSEQNDESDPFAKYGGKEIKTAHAR